MTICLLSTPAPAATVTAGSCSSAGVQAAIDSASTGDTVVVPAGSCSWGTAVSVPSSKKITLRGAGASASVITRTSFDTAVLDIAQSGSRVTGFSFVNGHIVADGDDFRIHDNSFSTSSGSIGIGVTVNGRRSSVHPRGLIDNNSFVNTRILVIGWLGLAAHELWAQPLALGSPQMVFIEDNAFSGASNPPQAVDTNYGGRYVFRYNRLTNRYAEVHSLQGGRGSRSWEIYNNTWTTTAPQWTPMFIRGGTGVVFNNVVSGSWGSPMITLDNVRSFSTGYDYGMCNGSSPADGNQASNGWPCRDQIGRGRDTALWTSAAPYSSQTSEPAYFWNNTAPNGGTLGVAVHNGTGAWIAAGRDFFNNTPRPGYTPYPYPHPLRGEPTAPPPPSNLIVQ